MALRPICEPVDLPLGTSVLAELVEHGDDSPPLGRLLHFHDVSQLVMFYAVRDSFLANSGRHDVAGVTLVLAPSTLNHYYEMAPSSTSRLHIQITPYILLPPPITPDTHRPLPPP